jgi:hypothetical protein
MRTAIALATPSATKYRWSRDRVGARHMVTFAVAAMALAVGTSIGGIVPLRWWCSAKHRAQGRWTASGHVIASALYLPYAFLRGWCQAPLRLPARRGMRILHLEPWDLTLLLDR